SRSVRAQSSKVILDYAFGNYKNYEYLKKDQEVYEIKLNKGLDSKVPVYSDKDISVPLKQEEVDRVKVIYNIPKVLEAPIKSDSKVGTIDYMLDGKMLASADIFNHETVERKDFYYYFDSIFKTWTRLVQKD
ncbi:MAG: D-alanyl-D-alanine carboxypeptidase, partial [Ruminiclostridium sp.]